MNLSGFYQDSAIGSANLSFAAELAQKGVLHLIKTNYHKVRAEAYAVLGEVYYRMGIYDEAQKQYDSALNEIDSFYININKPVWFDINQKIRFLNYVKFLHIDLLNNLINISLTKPDCKEAFTYQKRLIDAEKVMYQQGLQKELAEKSIAHLDEKNKEKISRLVLENEVLTIRKQQNQYLVYVFGSMMALILVSVYFIIRQVRLKEMQKSIILEQKLLRSRMNPHFIFNSLASIQGFMMEKDTRSASRYLSRFASLVRSILDDSTQEFISLEKEISTIENYLELQKVRFADKFDYHIDIDPDIDIETVMVPPMLAQPFIENSIEHGFKNKAGKGNLRVSFKMDEGCLVLEIEDDGIGREKAQEALMQHDKGHKSLATVITRERIAALNSRSKQKIALDIIDLKDERGEARGTKVVLRIPAGS